MQKERELSQVDKLVILNEKLSRENEEINMQNRALVEKVSKMKKVMVEYDQEAIE